MYNTICILAISLTGVLLFHQNDYKLIYERGEAIEFNQEFVSNLIVLNYKYNRTTALTNASFTYLKDLNNNVDVTVQVYKFMSNEYRLFPVRFLFDFCTACRNNEFGLGGFITCGNFTGCPIKKGAYHFCKFSTDESRFPPNIPNGRYMADLKVTSASADIMTLRAYGVVEHPLNKKPRTFRH